MHVYLRLRDDFSFQQIKMSKLFFAAKGNEQLTIVIQPFFILYLLYRINFLILTFIGHKRPFCFEYAVRD